MHMNKAKYTRISSKSLLKMRDTGYYAKYLTTAVISYWRMVHGQYQFIYVTLVVCQLSETRNQGYTEHSHPL